MGDPGRGEGKTIDQMTPDALRALPGTFLGKQHRLVDEAARARSGALTVPDTFRPFP
jgi:hypothetical protein